MRRVILTGASGFIGRHAIAHLHDRGFEVHGISRERHDGHGRVVWHTVDLNDTGQVERELAQIRATHLLHCAWYVEHGLFWNSPENLRCVESSAALLRCFRESGGERTVGVGTCAEYDLYGSEPLVESMEPVPNSFYGVCKDAVRRLLDGYAAAADQSWAWGRVFFPFGPGETATRLVPSVIASLLAGEHTRCSDGTQILDFMYVDDVAAALVALLDSDVRGPINICSGTPLEVREVVVRIGRVMNLGELIRFGDIPTGNQPRQIVGDPVRLKDELKFVPAHELDEALALTVNWWRDLEGRMR